MAQPVGVFCAGFRGHVGEPGNELQLVFVYHVVTTGHRTSRLDGRVVKRAATETIGRRAVENRQYAVARACTESVEGFLVGHPPGVVDTAQILLDQPRLAPEELV